MKNKKIFGLLMLFSLIFLIASVSATDINDVGGTINHDLNGDADIVSNNASTIELLSYMVLNSYMYFYPNHTDEQSNLWY